MLPGYMTYYLQKRVESQKKGKGKGKDGKDKDEAEPESDKATVMKAAKSGSVTALGLLGVYFVTGALVVFLGSSVSNKIGYMQLVVGIILIVLGGLMFSNLQYYRLVIPIQNAFAKLRKGGGAGTGEESGYYGGLFAYGAGYGAAAAGCTLPAFVAVIFGAMVSGSIWMGLIVVFLYSIVAALLMIGVTVGIAYFGQRAVQKLAAHTETIKKVSAAVLILVGVYLILFFLDSKGYISIFGNLGI
jgi:cytochrome c-type biogenesis protein